MKRIAIALGVLSLCVLSAAVTAYYYTSTIRQRQLTEAAVKGSQQQALDKLEAAQAELKRTLAQNQKLQDTLEKELQVEKQRFAGLQDKLWEVMAQNKSLIKKVVLYRIEERREQELERKLRENLRKNQELADQMLALKKKVELNLTQPPAAVSGNAENKLAWLTTKDELNQAELDKRQQTISSLQDTVQKMEEKLSLAFEQFKEMERDTALLRERNIALQIERETLLGDLNAARRELSAMQEKLTQIGGLLIAKGAAAQAGSFGEGEAAVPAGKKVDVELQRSKAAGAVK